MTLLPLILTLVVGPGVPDEAQRKGLVQDSDRPAISSVELKILRESNIFAPRAVTLHPRPSSKLSGTRSETPLSKPKPPVVTGIFLDPISNVYEIVLEDRNESLSRQFKEPKIMKSGEEWCGLKVELVQSDHAGCRIAGLAKELRVGDSLPEGEWTVAPAAKSSEEEPGEGGESSTPGSSSVQPQSRSSEAAPQTAEERGRVLEEMRRRNGKKHRPKEPDE